MFTVKETDSSRQRAAGGLFAKGNTMSPGRKRGSVNKALRLARQAAEEVALPMIIELAKQGDIDAAKALLQVGLPKNKATFELDPIDFKDADTPAEKLRRVMDAASKGTMNPESVELYCSLIKAEGELCTLDDIAARVSALEEKAK